MVELRGVGVREGVRFGSFRVGKREINCVHALAFVLGEKAAEVAPPLTLVVFVNVVTATEDLVLPLGWWIRTINTLMCITYIGPGQKQIEEDACQW